MTGGFGNPTDQTPGSVFGSTANVFAEPGHRAFGTFGIRCTDLYTTATDATTECVAVFDTPHGQITTEGIKTKPVNMAPGRFEQAITGGTGDFQGAAGEVHFDVTGQGTTTAVIHFRRAHA